MESLTRLRDSVLLQSMKRDTQKFLILFLAVTVIATLLAIIFSKPPKPPVNVLPDPNGYDSFVQAGTMILGNPGEFERMTRQELEQFVQDNSNALQVARSGLQQETKVPIEFTDTYKTNHVRDLLSLRKIAQSLAAEGRLLELQNHPEEAMKTYLEIVQLGNESSRGGVLIDALIGVAIENIGVNHAQNLVAKLDAKSARKTAETLLAIDQKITSWPDVLRQEKEFSRYLYVSFQYRIASLFMRGSLKASLAKGEQRFNESRMKLRRLIIASAARAYELEKGRPPKSASDLVPDYLKAVPEDPQTGKPLDFSP